MMSRTFGAPLGGTTRAGQYGFDCGALRSILPPNLGGGGGSCSPVMVVVALGEPGTPEISGAGGGCWARAGDDAQPSMTKVMIGPATAADPRMRLAKSIV